MADQEATLRYPPYVISDEDKRRWELSVGVAAQALGEPKDSEAVWSAARVMYHSDIPTDDPEPEA